MGFTLSVRSSGVMVSDNGRTGTVTNSYYDPSVSNPSSLDPNRGLTVVGTGLTTAQMQDLNTFRIVYAGWDYRNVWIPSNSAGQSDGVARYPEFYWANHVAVVETSNATRMYGDANTTLAAMIYGLKNYDTPNVMPITVSSTANQSSGVGTYAVSVRLDRYCRRRLLAAALPVKRASISSTSGCGSIMGPTLSADRAFDSTTDRRPHQPVHRAEWRHSAQSMEMVPSFSLVRSTFFAGSDGGDDWRWRGVAA